MLTWIIICILIVIALIKVFNNFKPVNNFYFVSVKMFQGSSY